MSEADRADQAYQYACHLPETSAPIQVSNADLDAMRAAMIRRFNEDLPRTETLMAVAHIGYRMALRDLAQGMSARQSQDPQGLGPQAASPVDEVDAPVLSRQDDGGVE